NRQATGTVFVNEVVDGPDGNMTSKMVAKTDNVNQTLGMTADQFKAIGLPSRPPAAPPHPRAAPAAVTPHLTPSRQPARRPPPPPSGIRRCGLHAAARQEHLR